MKFFWLCTGGMFFLLAYMIFIFLNAQTSSFVDVQAEKLIGQIEDEHDNRIQERLVAALTYLVGPKRAIFLLNESTLPKAGASHLLAHKVGEAAYDIYGEDALVYCEEDMRSGCSHGLLSKAITAVGFEGIRRMVDRCKTWSMFKYTMCLHAAGHAFLAFADYDIFPALENCDRLIDPSREESRFCYNGLFMENSHGVHGGRIPPQHPYLSATNLLIPCKIVDARYQKACYRNVAGWWYADVFHRDLQKTVAQCDSVPKQYLLDCVDNVARVISTVDDNNIEKMKVSCSLFRKPLDDECLSSIAFSLSSQGDEILPFVLCKKIVSKDIKQSCYQNLVIDYARREIPLEARNTYCEEFEPAYQHLCLSS